MILFPFLFVCLFVGYKVTILAQQGNCPIREKAQRASRLKEVRYLIVYQESQPQLDPSQSDIPTINATTTNATTTTTTTTKTSRRSLEVLGDWTSPYVTTRAASNDKRIRQPWKESLDDHHWEFGDMDDWTDDIAVTVLYVSFEDGEGTFQK